MQMIFSIKPPLIIQPIKKSGQLKKTKIKIQEYHNYSNFIQTNMIANSQSYNSNCKSCGNK
jgi:hypothetical protein